MNQITIAAQKVKTDYCELYKRNLFQFKEKKYRERFYGIAIFKDEQK